MSQFSVSGHHALAYVGHPVGTVDQHRGHVVLELGVPVHDHGKRGRRQREQVAVRVGPHADGTPGPRCPQARLAKVAAIAQRGHHLLATGHQHLNDALVHEVHLCGCSPFTHDRVTYRNKTDAKTSFIIHY